MQLSFSKKWHSNREIYNHLYRTFAIEHNYPNFINGVPVYSHRFTGCAIGNLVQEKTAARIQRYAEYYSLWTFTELYNHLMRNVNKNAKDLKSIVKFTFEEIDLQFLQDLQDLHDSKFMNSNGLQSIKMKYEL